MHFLICKGNVIITYIISISMTEQEKQSNVTVLGKRVLVEKERIDSGGLRLSPTMEAEGEKNRGRILAVGEIPPKLAMLGLEVGKTIMFKKHFIPNHVEGEIPMVFVETDDILAIL